MPGSHITLEERYERLRHAIQVRCKVDIGEWEALVSLVMRELQRGELVVGVGSRAPTEQELEAWMVEVCHRAGVRVHRFDDGSMGLVDVPAKYVAVIDALHCALISLLKNQGLPELAPAPLPKRRR